MSFYKFTLVLTAYILYVLFRRLPIRAFFDIQKEITMSKEDLASVNDASGLESARLGQLMGIFLFSTILCVPFFFPLPQNEGMVGYHHEAINGRELTTTEHSEAGLASGVATRLLIQPLDVLKIRFQLQEEPIRGKISGKYKGLFQSIRLIMKEEGLQALWKGHVPAQGLSAMYGLVQFSSFEFLSTAVGNRMPASSSDFLCGSSAGCIAMTCAMPLDVIRTRLVAQGNQGVIYRGTLHATKHIWKREGVPGYFRGWVPSIIQIAPFTGLQFAFYNIFLELWKKFVPDYETTGIAMSGAGAGTVAKTILYPLDMIRHRLQMNGFERKGFGKASRYQCGMFRALAHVIRHESAYGLFKGVIVSCHSICFTISKLVLGIAADRHSSVALLLTGLMIASLSSVILAYAQSFFTVLLVMIMVGAVQGAAWVPATKLVASWYEGSSFGTMFSLLGCGATVSGLIISPLSKYYWRDVGLYLGGSSCVFCVFALLALNEDNHSPKHYYDAGAKGSPFWDIISSKVIWGVSLCYIFTLETRTVAETWFPLFLEDNQLPISTFMVIYEISGIVGTMASGFLLDRISAHLPEENARRLVGVSSSLGMLLSYMLSTSYPEYNVVFAFLCGLFTNASMNMWCIIVAVAGQKHIAGSCSAFISFVANFGSIMAGSPLAHLISLYGYKVFVPFFATQIALLLAISSLRIPLKMGDKPKDE